MKFSSFLSVLCLAAGFTACSHNDATTTNNTSNIWKDYPVGTICFHDEAPESDGSKYYHEIISDPATYITEQAHTVLSTLYFSPEDSIVPVDTLNYYLRDIDGISAKDGGNGIISIFYSTRHIEKSFAARDTANLLFETRGVLLHELTHAFQLEPQGIGNYGNSRVFWAFIEGMADAVRVANDGFHADARPKGGNYMDGYRTTGYFFVWLRDHKDPDFLRKINRSTLEVIPWSFGEAVKYALGAEADIDELWHEYQIAVGDIAE